MTPLPRDSIIFWAFLTRREWQFVYALQFALEILEKVPVRDLVTGTKDILADAQRTYGHRWESLAVNDDDLIEVELPDEPTCPENLLAVAMMQRGISPDIETHLKAALEYADQHDETLGHYIGDLQRAKMLSDEIDRGHKQAYEELSDEDKDLWDRMLRDAISSMAQRDEVN